MSGEVNESSDGTSFASPPRLSSKTLHQVAKQEEEQKKHIRKVSWIRSSFVLKYALNSEICVILAI